MSFLLPVILSIVAVAIIGTGVSQIDGADDE
jgi:hypothetical protein